MESNNCIISVGVSGWYPKGIQRLRKSLKDTGYTGSSILWEGTMPPGSLPHSESPYNFKIMAFEFALSKGYKNILWVDASVWAIKNPDNLFAYIQEHGHYCFKTGYNLAQSCNDNILKVTDITRDQAEGMTEAATGCIGFNFENLVSSGAFYMWENYMAMGLFKGSRFHDNQSADPRFLFHRQDQSAWSIVANQVGLPINDSGDWVAYKAHETYFQNQLNHETLSFLIEGM